MSGLYRKNAAAVVFRQDKKVLLFRRAACESGKEWQFPQGGIDENEDYGKATRRELFEETNISSVRLVKTLSEPLKYEFPKSLDDWKKKNKIEFVGQEQYWSLFYFFGDDSEINFDRHGHQELSGYKWVNIRECLDNVWEPKRKVYEKVVEAFEPIILNFDVDSI